MTSRRFSQAIAEGDGISLIVPVDDVVAARAAESQRAEAVLVTGDLAGLREATALPILWRAPGSLEEAKRCGADACLLVADGFGAEALASSHAHALELGLEPAVEVRDADGLEAVIEGIDPEIFVLSPPGARDGVARAVELTLELLADLPAGKLAIADVLVASREEIEELERAGVDGVIVGGGSIVELVGAEPPEV